MRRYELRWRLISDALSLGPFWTFQIVPFVGPAPRLATFHGEMPRHLVFVGAPTSVAAREEILDSSALYKWRTVIANRPPATHELTESAASVLDVSKLSSATLEEASRRISRLYEHIIFSDAEDPEEDDAVASEEFHDTQGIVVYEAHL